MLTPPELRAFADRRYRDVLVAIAEGRSLFPLRVPLGEVPTDDLAALKGGNDALAGESRERLGYGITIAWGTTKTRLFNAQRVPVNLSFGSESDYARYVRHDADIHAFHANVALTRVEMPTLLPWMASHPLRVVEKAKIWGDLLKVCAYFIAHPRPGIYPREIRLPLGSKFIEDEQIILRSLLDAVLPDSARTASPDFHDRFGLKVDEVQVRVRWLGSPPAGAAVSLADFTTPLSVLAATDLAPQGVIIVENKTTFLTLPPMGSGWLALLGNGFSVVVCGALPWLRERPLFYWGDIDPAGLQILARLRAQCPKTQSVLMDEATLQKHAAWWTKPGEVPDTTPPTLTPEEKKLYDDVRTRGIQLEQERILQEWVEAAFADSNRLGNRQ